MTYLVSPGVQTYYATVYALCAKKQYKIGEHPKLGHLSFYAGTQQSQGSDIRGSKHRARPGRGLPGAGRVGAWVWSERLSHGRNRKIEIAKCPPKIASGRPARHLSARKAPRHAHAAAHLCCSTPCDQRMSITLSSNVLPPPTRRELRSARSKSAAAHSMSTPQKMPTA